MVKQTKSDERPFLDIAKTQLIEIFAQARNGGEELSPDLALLRMWERLGVAFPNPGNTSEGAKRRTRRGPKSDIARLKKLHHFAVDQYYKTYFPEGSGPGRPARPADVALEAQKMKEAGHTWPEIRDQLGDPIGADTPDMYRKLASRHKK